MKNKPTKAVKTNGLKQQKMQHNENYAKDKAKIMQDAKLQKQN